MFVLKDAPDLRAGRFAADALAQRGRDRQKGRNGSVSAGSTDLDPLKVSIARLSVEELRAMERADLVELIRLSGVFPARDWTAQLGTMNQEDLDRVAFLARGCCRHEVISVYRRWGREVPFLLDL